MIDPSVALPGVNLSVGADCVKKVLRTWEMETRSVWVGKVGKD